MIQAFFIISACSLSLPLLADCLACTAVKTDGSLSAASQTVYIKKCIAKQKDIEGSICGFCKCPRTSHSVHRHPYKMHNGIKLSSQPLETLFQKQKKGAV